MRAARADLEPDHDELVSPGDRDATAQPTPGAPSVTGGRAALLKVWLPIPLLLLAFDLTFPLWFWHIPKLTGAAADYGYQFLVDTHQLGAAPPAPGTVRVLAVGSSVAGSFDSQQVEHLLGSALPDVPVDVHRLLLPGIKPSDLRLFFATEGAGLRPDVALVLLNPLDFLNPSFERDLKPQVRYVLPPWETLRERSAFIPTISGKLDLALASVSNLYRYRKLIRSSFEDHALLAWRWLHSRPATRGYGWYADGYTRQDFGLPLGAGDALELEYYVHPEWIRQRGQVTLQFATARGVLARQTERTPGWKRVQLALPNGHGPLLHVSADSAWSPRAAGLGTDTRLLGLQLRAPPLDGARDGDRPPLRYPPLERERPDQLLRMRGATGAEFEQRWQALLDADTEFGRRFRAYRDAKLALRDAPVDPTGEYAELERLVALLSERGAAVLLINNPESALLRAKYEDSPYYRSYVAYLQELAARSPRTQFHDLRAQLPADDFNDWHHVTYIGQIKMGPVYAELLRGLVAQARHDHPGERSVLFNSIAFLCFLPLVLLGVSALPQRWRNPFLLAASYVFYGAWDWRFLFLLFGTTCVDYWAAGQIAASAAPPRRRAFLLLSLGTNLAVLGFFKYYNFFAGSAAQVLGALGIHASPWTLSVILPVGVSFYTFQSMAYVIDVYRGDMQPATRFRDYALAVAFFPQLVAGPIERISHLLPQLLAQVRPAPERIQVGLTLMILGFTKKVLIADVLAPEVDRIFTSPAHMSSGLLLKGAYCFALQIYGDFSGYSDIARGVAALLGVRLIKNFEQPYLSQSITEFWRRWHISLSSWLRDYLYISLGGNRRGAWMTYRNLMVTMLIGGLWHGANWTFVVWGGLHGAYLALERMLGVGRERVQWIGAGALAWAAGVARIVVTFHLVTLAWIFFRAPNIAAALEYVRGILRFDHLGAVGPVPFVAAAAVLALDVPQYASGRHAVFMRLPWWLQSPAYAAICLGLILYGGSEVPFIYFQF